MGVKFGREYAEIVEDFREAILRIEGLYEFFEMNAEEWEQLTEDEQRECVTTMADDLFYALGQQSELPVGDGMVIYDQSHHIIKVATGDNVVHVVNLV